IVNADLTRGNAALPNPRLSPSGRHVAYFTCDAGGCAVKVADHEGKAVAESRPFFDWWGLAWAPGGREVWFAVAESTGRQCTLYALDLNGRPRLISRVPRAMTVSDG